MANNGSSITAALVLVGNELLSGRTQDINLNYVAKRLVDHGIALTEARVISDVAEVIQSTVNELRARHDYVFTTGGIGPTHDDITAENIAEAFGLELIVHPEAERLLRQYFEKRGVEANAARMRMARTPYGATLIDNPVSVAPGFKIENVYVMAGVPRIMQAMFENIVPTLRHGEIVESVSVICDLPEGQLAEPLEKIQDRFPAVDIGSYPGKTSDTIRVNLVARCADQPTLELVEDALKQLVDSLGGNLLD